MKNTENKNAFFSLFIVYNKYSQSSMWEFISRLVNNHICQEENKNPLYIFSFLDEILRDYNKYTQRCFYSKKKWSRCRRCIMTYSITKLDYYYTTVRDEPGEAYKILSIFKEVGINLQAFTAIPVGSDTTQLAIFPEDNEKFLSESKKAGMVLEGPHKALMVQGDDELGALADIHHKLFKANVNVYSSSGVTDGKGSYSYLIYVKSADFVRASKALEL